MASNWSYAKQFGFPERHVDRVLWNAGFEKLMEIAKRTDHIRHSSGLLSGGGPSIQEILINIRSSQQDLCIEQRDLTIRAAKSFAEDDFEARWLEAGTSVLQNHLLEGIVRVCSVPDSREDLRMFCPEVTLPYLLKENGRGFLRLLKSAMIQDTSSVPSSPIFLPSSEFDVMMGIGKYEASEKEKHMQYHHTLRRNEFIYHFLSHTLASFHGHPFVPPRVKKASTPDRLGGELKSHLKAIYGETAFAAMYRDDVAERQALVVVCENIGCPNSEDRISVKFSACSKCKLNLQGRRIYYCSKECQRADWPRHKLICGKELKLEDIITSERAGSVSAQASSREPWSSPELLSGKCGPAAAGYKRSPALQHQVSILDSHPDIDYVFFFESSSPRRSMIIQDALRKFHFRDLRREATTSGDRAAVAAMAQFVAECHTTQLGLTRETIMSQLGREYQFDVARAVEELDKSRARDPRRLLEIEKAYDDMRDLIMNPGRAEQRTAVYAEIAKQLRGLHMQG